MSIIYSGEVTFCCNDFSNRIIAGNTKTEELETIWQNKIFYSAKKLLYAGKRIFEPCKGCNHTSYRVELLPDRMGKDTLPRSTTNDLNFLKKHIKKKKVIGEAIKWQPKK